MTDELRDRLQALAYQIPGYAGYRAKEQRRDTDKLLRTHLAQQYTGVRQALTRLAQRVASSGRIAYSARIEQIDQALGLFITRLQTAPRGYAGWFSTVKIDEYDLDQIYAFDAGLANGLSPLRERVTFAESAFATEKGEGFDNALTELQNFVDGLNAQFDARQAFVTLGKRD